MFQEEMSEVREIAGGILVVAAVMFWQGMKLCNATWRPPSPRLLPQKPTIVNHQLSIHPLRAGLVAWLVS